MQEFDYRGGQLAAEQVPLADIAEAVGTPFYCYSTAGITRRYQALADAFASRDTLIAYSVKANPNQAVIATLAHLGAGADVVSEGETRRALAAGILPEKIVFSGVGKTRAEMAFALQHGVTRINVESEPELNQLSQVAAALGVTARIALRVNPDIDAGTHDKIATGRRGDKFGIDIARAPTLYRRAAALPGILVEGVDVHIGSQITELTPFRRAFARTAELVRQLRADGHAIARLDLGGGLGIRYGAETPPSAVEYAAMIDDVTAGLDCRLVIEPGRAIVGNAGVLVTGVIYDKWESGRRFVIVDAAMNDLLRPTLYGARHRTALLTPPPAAAPLTPADLVGPVCESGDCFAADIPLPPLTPGDRLALFSAGAYGATMASTYNSRLLIPEVMVSGNRFAIVRPRVDYATLIGQDRLPEWLEDAETRPTEQRQSA